MSDFMQRQITGKMTWIEIDGHFGITAVPAEDVPELTKAVSEHEPKPVLQQLAEQCYEGTKGSIWEVDIVEGFGARLSAPGYLDCTEWTVFDTEDEARAYLDEYYPEDEETGDPCPC
jgi:hypothetical protein